MFASLRDAEFIERRAVLFLILFSTLLRFLTGLEAVILLLTNYVQLYSSLRSA